ncbi:myoD family inhibitor isoform X1 [Carcharodon carcharias]|uniref:myoD family inhibitor isoform X1 n=2 Tax=Carcharodon carcharias TaxID=13397 RepID=UPI001B7EFFE2|nr:myoD family inhibitor isoform X1 [Carcharodon carcharias]
MSQDNSKCCSYQKQESLPTAQGTQSSRDRDDESECSEDHMLSREDTAPLEERTAQQEAENKAGGHSSAVDAIIFQPETSLPARCSALEDAEESPVLSQNGIRQTAHSNSTETEAVTTSQSPATHAPAGHRVRGSVVEHLTPLTSDNQHGKLHSYPSINSQYSKKSKSSSRSTASQIPSDAEEDCCVHCILACLFCQFLTLCNLVLDCATCGTCTSDSSCCFCCGSEECAPCDLPCDLDCGIVDACCESADCLEICMECCGLCFSS